MRTRSDAATRSRRTSARRRSRSTPRCWSCCTISTRSRRSFARSIRPSTSSCCSRRRRRRALLGSIFVFWSAAVLAAAVGRLARSRGTCRRPGRPTTAGGTPALRGLTTCSAHIPWALNHAASCLKTVDAHTFGRRNPVQTHERSKAEPLYAALLVVLHDLDKITPVIREIDPAIDEQLLQPPAHG